MRELNLRALSSHAKDLHLINYPYLFSLFNLVRFKEPFMQKMRQPRLTYENFTDKESVARFTIGLIYISALLYVHFWEILPYLMNK